MVQYNPKDWITFIFRFHKADTFRQLIPMMITIGLFSYGVAYLEIGVLEIIRTKSCKKHYHHARNVRFCDFITISF